MLNTSEAAERLSVTVQRIHQLIKEGLLPAQKIGRDYIINESDLKSVSVRRSVGRPRKDAKEVSGSDGKVTTKAKLSKKGRKK
ncbi:MAG: helix-turn-helix domain-containing protein [Pyrinomonadaceae bacterium]